MCDLNCSGARCLYVSSVKVDAFEAGPVDWPVRRHCGQDDQMPYRLIDCSRAKINTPQALEQF